MMPHSIIHTFAPYVSADDDSLGHEAFLLTVASRILRDVAGRWIVATDPDIRALAHGVAADLIEILETGRLLR